MDSSQLFFQRGILKHFLLVLFELIPHIFGVHGHIFKDGLEFQDHGFLLAYSFFILIRSFELSVKLCDLHIHGLCVVVQGLQLDQDIRPTGDIFLCALECLFKLLVAFSLASVRLRDFQNPVSDLFVLHHLQILPISDDLGV